MTRESPGSPGCERAESYVVKHLHPDQGIRYDLRYATDPWLQYVSSREEEVLRRLLKDLFGERRVRLLDFACGTGRVLAALEGDVAYATGVDVSEPMLAEARKKLKRSRLIRANILEDRPLEGEEFDLITAFRFFVNAEPPLRFSVLRALGHLLAPGGYLVFNDHHNPRSLRWGYRRCVTTLRGKPDDLNFLTVRDCLRLAQSGGLEVVAMYSVGLLHVPKAPVQPRLCLACDRLAGHFGPLASLSECPILVCRRASGAARAH